MRPIIGQKKLVDTLFKYNIHTVPKTILFLGPSGCGKSWVSAGFAEHLGLDTVDIKLNDLTPEEIRIKLADAYLCPVEKLYLIDLKGASTKKQDVLLKYIEEPTKCMFFILTAESEIGILPTILNRCLKYNFEPYTVEDLKQFDWMFTCSDDLIYALCKTPGQLLSFTETNIPDLHDLCEKILKYTKTANYANTISIITKINCKTDYNKFDVDLFLNMLEFTAFNKFVKENDQFSFDVYKYIIKQKGELLNRTIIKESFMLEFLDNLWRLAH